MNKYVMGWEDRVYFMSIQQNYYWVYVWILRRCCRERERDRERERERGLHYREARLGKGEDNMMYL